MNKFKMAILAAAVGVTLTACNNSSDGGSTQYDFTATAIDGYLKNAKMTAECTVPENESEVVTFEATTNEKGQAGFVTNGIPASNCKISVTSKKGTVDMETGITYEEGDINFTAPKGHVVASPFTTLVDEKIKDSGGSVEVDSAIDEVANEIGIDSELVTSDYVAAASDNGKAPEDRTAARSAALKAVALTMVLPVDKDAFTDPDHPVTTGDVVKAVIAAVEQLINDAQTQATDLNDLKIVNVTVTQDPEDGSLQVDIETEGSSDDTGDGTGDNTGGTGTGSGSGSGGDGSYIGTGA